MSDEGRPKGFEIKVNRVEFLEHHRDRSGLQIKEDAIQAGVRIQRTYVLDEETPEGPIRINDDTVVEIRSGLCFVAHPGGSDS